MPTEKEIYQSHADQYERLIQREDYQGNLLPAIEKIVPLNGLDVVELGAGTGRLTRLLAPHVRTIRAFDESGHMLKVAEETLRKLGLTNCKTGIADHRQVPAGDASADLVISGWSFCYLAVWGGKKWRSALQAGLSEIERILRPGGAVILIETLGTFEGAPNPPEHLKGYFAWLDKQGLQSTWIRTDYKFENTYEAKELISFFFGRNLASEVDFVYGTTLPECTGIWWKRVKSVHV